MKAWVTVHMLDGRKRRGLLTTEYAASSYGLPVVVLDGRARGSAKVAAIEAPAKWREQATRAGYRVRVGA